MVIFLEIAGGLLLLLAGGEILVRGSVALASRLGVSPLVIGLSVVAFGTSAPELVVCLIAALQNAPAIAVGNVVGSNVANILLVLGAAGLIYPIQRHARSLYRDGSVAIGATVLLVALSYAGVIEAWHGVVMLLLLGLYLVSCYWTDRRDRQAIAEVEREVRELEADHVSIWVAALLFAGGLAGVLVGSDILVDGAVGLAATAGISQKVIGVTVVALGTSLPELAISVVAAVHKRTDMALGNALGSNIFNVLAILGTVSLVRPVVVPPEVLSLDIWVMLAAIVVFVPLAAFSRHVGRAPSFLFVVAYAAYLLLQFVDGGTLA